MHLHTDSLAPCWCHDSPLLLLLASTLITVRLSGLLAASCWADTEAATRDFESIYAEVEEVGGQTGMKYRQDCGSWGG